MNKFLITGTDTGVGKTMFGCALAFALKVRGLRVGVMKPAETGCEPGPTGALQPLDAMALQAAASSPLPLELICPFRYRTPLAPAMAAEVDDLPPPNPDEIERVFRQIASESDVVLVEGAGGLCVPLAWSFDFADLARRLGLVLVVLVANRLGCLNAAVLTLEHAARRGLEIAGYVLNDAEPAVSPAARTNNQALRHLVHARCLGTVRFKEPVGLAVLEPLLQLSPRA